MISHKPRISVRRVVVTKGDKHVYDQTFHDGINIIRGDNGTGKSTIIEFIYYALGGDVKAWTKEALWCECVYCETNLNDKLFTFIRDIENNEQTRMSIYEGNYDLAIKNKKDWKVYSYRRSEQKKSFSQVIFDILGLPYHKTDEYANLTLHQLLRLIYLDQITPPTIIFREEDSRHDSETTRTAIGEYLLGLDDLESHKLRQDLIVMNKEFEQIGGELRALYRFLGGQNALLNEKNVLSAINNVKEAIVLKNTELKNIKNMAEDKLSTEIAASAKKLRETIETLNAENVVLTDRKNEILLEIMDSDLFITNLQQKLNNIEEADTAFNSLGALSFKYCPACMAVINNNMDSDCPLCKTPKSSHDTRNAYLAIRQEIEFQIAESTKIIKTKADKINELNSLINDKTYVIDKSKSDYKELTDSISLYDAKSSQLLLEIGSLENSINNLVDKMKMAKELDVLSDKKEKIAGKIEKIKDKIAQLKAENSRRREQVADRLKQLALEIIRLDDFEPEFEAAEEFDYDFGKNKTEINGRSRFSASSMVYLKNTFRLAILLASLEDNKMRLPRFLLMDNIEDKGMQPERSQTFQHAMIDFTSKYEQPFQVIFTTSMIAPDLNNTALCVGPFYPKGKHTLQFGFSDSPLSTV
jgi:DNA repair exonuclease SbcCD ATPase subunit